MVPAGLRIRRKLNLTFNITFNSVLNTKHIVPGKIGYGTRMILWRKQVHTEFPYTWRQCASTFFLIHACGWGGLPADVVCYVLNFCGWDWFGEVKKEVRGDKLLLVFWAICFLFLC